MARPLVKKLVQQRIQVSKQVMKDEGNVVLTAMKEATKGTPVKAAETRTALANFIKAAKAFHADTAKLASIKEQ